MSMITCFSLVSLFHTLHIVLVIECLVINLFQSPLSILTMRIWWNCFRSEPYIFCGGCWMDARWTWMHHMTFQTGLFGLDKLEWINQTIDILKGAIEQIVASSHLQTSSNSSRNLQHGRTCVCSTAMSWRWPCNCTLYTGTSQQIE